VITRNCSWIACEKPFENVIDQLEGNTISNNLGAAKYAGLQLKASLPLTFIADCFTCKTQTRMCYSTQKLIILRLRGLIGVNFRTSYPILWASHRFITGQCRLGVLVYVKIGPMHGV
jgi:hypothetical protein